MGRGQGLIVQPLDALLQSINGDLVGGGAFALLAEKANVLTLRGVQEPIESAVEFDDRVIAAGGDIGELAGRLRGGGASRRCKIRRHACKAGYLCDRKFGRANKSRDSRSCLIARYPDIPELFNEVAKLVGGGLALQSH